jgi:hypothetical protein
MDFQLGCDGEAEWGKKIREEEKQILMIKFIADRVQQLFIYRGKNAD